jgi:hypothetical protein
MPGMVGFGAVCGLPCGVTSGSDGPAPKVAGGRCSALGAAARCGLASWSVRLCT